MARSLIPCSSLKVAGVVVAVVEVILTLLCVYGLFRNWYLFGSSYFLWWLLGIISVVVIFIAIALLLYAIHSGKARWLIPHLSAQIFLIIFLILIALVVFILLLFGAYKGIRNLVGIYEYEMSDDSTFIMGIMIIVIYLLVAVLEVFFLYIIWKLYKHLREYEGFDEKNMKWSTIGQLPKDNSHGSPTMGDVYPYGDGEKERML